LGRFETELQGFLKIRHFQSRLIEAALPTNPHYFPSELLKAFALNGSIYCKEKDSLKPIVEVNKINPISHSGAESYAFLDFHLSLLDNTALSCAQQQISPIDFDGKERHPERVPRSVDFCRLSVLISEYPGYAQARALVLLTCYE